MWFFLHKVEKSCLLIIIFRVNQKRLYLTVISLYSHFVLLMYKMCNMALKSTPLSLLWLMFCAMINASDPTFHLFCGFKYPPSCFCVCWKIKMQIISMKQVNFVNSSIHHGGLKYPPWWIGLSTILICVYFENKNAYLKQETSEIVVKSIHHGGLLFNCIIINLKSSENKERWRLSTISFVNLDVIAYSRHLVFL